MTLKSISYIIRHPYGIILKIADYLNFDKLYLKIWYHNRMGYWMDFNNPKTFNEKLQWLKLYNRKPEYTTMVDKYAVKKYVADIIGEQYIIPTLGVWEKFDDIDFDALPNQFVLKCTHDSGGLVICRDKQTLNIAEVKKKIVRCQGNDFYRLGREWPYKNVPRRIIAEKYMIDEKTNDLRDYKFFCFNGQPRLIQVDFGRFTNHRRNIYDLEWNLINLEIQYPSDHSIAIEKPSTLSQMIHASAELSQGIPVCRVDLYEVNGRMYFGEFTFYHGSGQEKFTPKEWNLKLGQMINIDNIR